MPPKSATTCICIQPSPYNAPSTFVAHHTHRPTSRVCLRRAQTCPTTSHSTLQPTERLRMMPATPSSTRGRFHTEGRIRGIVSVCRLLVRLRAMVRRLHTHSLVSLTMLLSAKLDNNVSLLRRSQASPISDLNGARRGPSTPLVYPRPSPDPAFPPSVHIQPIRPPVIPKSTSSGPRTHVGEAIWADMSSSRPCVIHASRTISGPLHHCVAHICEPRNTPNVPTSGSIARFNTLSTYHWQPTARTCASALKWHGTRGRLGSGGLSIS
ncbi:hypothetical protein C8F01DRAFT_276141 [Mycena amicta]|nr:hypothetical protein C8F01DRAFT_276141 [Mycena amicta]